ncbi:DUF1905 domain-containing protein [Agromyces sp. MMS24-K17]|uniref:DUF1905 domain-containing protein n=1 Tax=Agromyces sp. MMS24-K17 TaxID=3372850 RepID=UPI003753FFD5
MDFAFAGELWFWRGPAPHHFVTVPPDACEAIAEVASAVTYGWGMIPVGVHVGGTRWTTSLWPKDGGYILPVRADVRRRERLDLGDVFDVRMSVAV